MPIRMAIDFQDADVEGEVERFEVVAGIPLAV